MNIPNLLSLSRIFGGIVVLILLILGFNNSLAGGILVGAIFVIFGLTDIFDGYLARKRNKVSVQGALLDNSTDKILILPPLIYLGFKWAKLSYLAAILVGLPIIIIVVREISVFAARIFLRNSKDAVTSKMIGKVKNWAEAGAVLFLIVNHIIFSIPVLWIAAILALISGLEFFWKFPRKIRS